MDFTEKLEKEYKYFLNAWVNAKYELSPKEYRVALKSFILFMEDAGEMCKQKGECFDFWFNQEITTPEYRKARKEELEELENNFEVKMKQYQQMQEKLEYASIRAPQLKSLIISTLKENPGILQSEFWKLFNEKDEQIVKDLVYEFKNEGKIEREKAGRSYKLFYKG